MKTLSRPRSPPARGGPSTGLIVDRWVIYARIFPHRSLLHNSIVVGVEANMERWWSEHGANLERTWSEHGAKNERTTIDKSPPLLLRLIYASSSPLQAYKSPFFPCLFRTNSVKSAKLTELIRNWYGIDTELRRSSYMAKAKQSRSKAMAKHKDGDGPNWKVKSENWRWATQAAAKPVRGNIYKPRVKPWASERHPSLTGSPIGATFSISLCIRNKTKENLWNISHPKWATRDTITKTRKTFQSLFKTLCCRLRNYFLSGSLATDFRYWF